MSFVFEVAISYVRAQRSLAKDVSSALEQRGLPVFFDREDIDAIVGHEGTAVLRNLYMAQARVCVLLLSPQYEESDWTTIERDAVLARRQTDRAPFLIPVRVEGEPPAWLPRQLLYFDLQRQTLDELIDLVATRVERLRGVSRAVPELLATLPVGIGTMKTEIIADGEWLYVPTAGSVHNQPDPGDGVVCLRTDDLTEAWRAPTRHDANALLQEDSALYVGTDAGTVESFDAATGGALWPDPPQLSAAVLARPTPTPAGILVCAVDGDAALIDRSSGAFLERGRIPGGLVGDPLVVGERLIFASQAGWVVEAPLAAPLQWTQEESAEDVRKVEITRDDFDGNPVPCWLTASPVRLEGTVFLPHSRETYLAGLPVAALELRRFQPRYSIAELERPQQRDDFGNVRARPAVVAGLVIVPASYSNLTVAFDRDGGIVWAEPCGWSAFHQYGSPAPYGTDVLVPRFDGALHNVDTRDGRRTWSIALGIEGRVGEVFFGTDTLPGEHDDPWWEAPDRTPLNAPVTVVGDRAYVVDAAGNLHVLGLPHSEGGGAG